MRPRPGLHETEAEAETKTITVRPETETDTKKWSRYHAGLKTLTSLIHIMLFSIYYQS